MGYLHFKIWTESSLIFGCLKRSKIWIRTKLVYNLLPIRNTKAKKSPFPWDCEMRRDVRPFNYLYEFVAGARALIYNPDSFLDLTIGLYIPFIFWRFGIRQVKIKSRHWNTIRVKAIQERLRVVKWNASFEIAIAVKKWFQMNENHLKWMFLWRKHPQC